MSLTRKMLKGMGIEEEKIDSIIDAHTEVVEALKQEKADAIAKADELKEFKKKFEQLNSENWAEKYAALENEYNLFKSDIDTQKTTAKKVEAYKKLLTECNIDSTTHEACVNASAQDIETIEFDESGNILNADTVKGLINSKWSGFVVSTTTIGANPPKGSGSTKMSKADILSISDDAERQKAIAQNLNLFKGD